MSNERKEIVMVIKARNRRETIDNFQKVLTEFGCIIKMRLGLHEAGDVCSDEGLIILQLVDEGDMRAKFEDELDKLDGISFKTVQI